MQNQITYTHTHITRYLHLEENSCIGQEWLNNMVVATRPLSDVKCTEHYRGYKHK